MNSFLKPDGTPNLAELKKVFNRCAPTVSGGMDWLDQVRDCRWKNQWDDGRKHDVPGDPQGKAQPWDGASDCRPFVVDDIINEAADVDVVAFWRAMLQQGAADAQDSSYAVALAEWLVFTKLVGQLIDEVELSAQYRHHYGWCVPMARWRREIGLRRYTLKLDQIAGAAQKAQAQYEPAQKQGAPDAFLQQLQAIIQLPAVIKDPTLEAQAVDYLQQWYDRYVQDTLPKDMRERAPKIKRERIVKCVQDLRNTGECMVPLPYLCKNEAQISALKPYEEVCIPNEMVNVQELVFQLEWVSEATLKGRQISEAYNPDWVALAITKKGGAGAEQLTTRSQPLGLSMLTGASSSQAPARTTGTDTNADLIRIVHAIYKETDADGIPGIYETTLHPDITTDKSGKDLVAAHGLMQGADGELPYSELVRERRSRPITASRGVAELAHTDQNIIKGIRDGVIDRQSITLLPPVNVYESPTGTKYQFGPAKQNYVRAGKEPKFMELPSGQGLADAVETHNLVTSNVDKRFGRMGADVPPMRIQIAQEKNVRRFLITWTKVIKQALCLYQQFGDDAEFSKITGAPAGWLEERRQQPGLLSCALDFDVRELDPELMLKRIEAMNQIVLPNDVLGVVQRGKWAEIMTRAVLGPATAKQLVQSMPDASQALYDKAKAEVLSMFVGNAPRYVDKDDPTAASLLKFTLRVVMENPNYLRNLSDEALSAIAAAANQPPQQLAQQIGPRNPDARFSALLMKWLENLKFIGVTQVQNRQTGQIGVNPNEQPQTAGAMAGGY